MERMKGTKMTRNENIALIIEHIVNQGYDSSDKFVEFVTVVLPMMTDEDIEAELCLLEEKAYANMQDPFEFEDVPF